MSVKRKYRKRPLEQHHHKWLENISAYLLECRQWKGQSRESFADENNISRNFLESIENAKHFPTLSSVFLLCDLYDITPEELFQGVE
ncbi:MAG: helix-turn-helix transcriptional regulator [Bacteroidales bacterium]|nr:helix-turn-helix transcriptional regulator [Bacteroidales bacterium]